MGGGWAGESGGPAVKLRRSSSIRFYSFYTPLRRWRGGFMGCRRCRRPIVGSYEWGAEESLEIVRAYCPTLSWHEVGMNCFELGLNFMWGSVDLSWICAGFDQYIKDSGSGRLDLS